MTKRSEMDMTGEFRKPGEQAKALALELAKRWWDEGKLSWNWDPDTDVEFLASVIENHKVPNAQHDRPASAGPG